MTEPKSLCYFVQPKVGKEPLFAPAHQQIPSKIQWNQCGEAASTMLV